jgi:hypothetical protein
LSISEDAVRSFESRLVERRDIFESTFDEILFIERLDLETCARLAHVRFSEAGYDREEREIPEVEEAIQIAGILSTGVPRELLRNLRAVEAVAGSVLALEAGQAWHTLFRRKVREVLEHVRAAKGLNGRRAVLVEDLENLFTVPSSHFSLMETRKVVSGVSGQIKELREFTHKQETEAARAAIETRRADLLVEIELAGIWQKYWLEIVIYLFVRIYNLEAAGATGQGEKEERFGRLLHAYAVLPYSTEACALRLEKLSGVSLDAAA